MDQYLEEALDEDEEGDFDTPVRICDDWHLCLCFVTDCLHAFVLESLTIWHDHSWEKAIVWKLTL